MCLLCVQDVIAPNARFIVSHSLAVFSSLFFDSFILLHLVFLLLTVEQQFFPIYNVEAEAGLLSRNIFCYFASMSPVNIISLYEPKWNNNNSSSSSCKAEKKKSNEIPQNPWIKRTMKTNGKITYMQQNRQQKKNQTPATTSNNNRRRRRRRQQRIANYFEERKKFCDVWVGSVRFARIFLFSLAVTRIGMLLPAFSQ